MLGNRSRLRTLVTVAILAPLTSCVSFSSEPRRPDVLMAAVGSPGSVAAHPGLTHLDSALKKLPERGPRLPAHSIATSLDGRWIYLGTVDGVAVSRDGGRSFWLSGTRTLQGVLDTAAHPIRPQSVFAATTRGLFYTSDITTGTGRWRPFKPTSRFRYCTDVHLDRTEPQSVWLGTEAGLFVAGSRDTLFRQVGPRAEVHQVLQDPSNADVFWVATDDGVHLSRDHGRTWRHLADGPKACSAVAPDPREPGGVLYAGRGMIASITPSGSISNRASNGLESNLAIYDICADPAHPGHLLLATNNGVYESFDDGDWRAAALLGRAVHDLEFFASSNSAAEPRTAAAPVPGPKATPSRTPASADAGFPVRQREIGMAIADATDSGPVANLYRALAQVKEGRTSESLWASVRSALQQPTTTLEREVALLALYWHARKVMPRDLLGRFADRAARRTLVRDRGELRALQYDTALLLSAWIVPDAPAEDWFNGLSAAENASVAAASFVATCQMRSRRGQREFDSPSSLAGTLACLLLIHDFTPDRRLRAFAANMLELALADYLTESLDGAWCGARGALLPGEEFLTSNHPIAACHYLYAAGIPRPKAIPAWLALGAYSWFQPPALLATIAKERSTPYESKEFERGPEVLRERGAPSGPWLRYTYMTKTFGLGSVHNPEPPRFNQRTFQLNWKSTAKDAVLFAVHPSTSASTLRRHVAGDRHERITAVERSYPDFTRTTKWISGSPYEHTHQQKNTLLTLYAFPQSEPNREVHISLPACLEIERKGSWLFGKDGDFHVALWSNVEGELGADTTAATRRRYRLRGDRIGLVLIAGSRSVNPPGMLVPEDFATFRDRILARTTPQVAEDDGGARLRVPFTDGTELSVTSGKAPVATPSKLLDSPFASSWWNSGQIQLTAGGDSQTLSFGPTK